MENLTYDELVKDYWSVTPGCLGYNRKDPFDRDILIEKIISRLIEDNEVYVSSNRVIILNPVESWLKEVKKELIEGKKHNFDSIDLDTTNTLSIEVKNDTIYIIHSNEFATEWYTMTKDEFIKRPLNNEEKDGLIQIVKELLN